MLDSIIMHHNNSYWGFQDLKQGDLLIFGLFFSILEHCRLGFQKCDFTFFGGSFALWQYQNKSKGQKKNTFALFIVLATLFAESAQILLQWKPHFWEQNKAINAHAAAASQPVRLDGGGGILHCHLFWAQKCFFL